MPKKPKPPAVAEPVMRTSRVETWALEDLSQNPRNSRRHPPEQVAQIAASMTEFGWTIPILATPDGMIIAGHGRYMAALSLGLAEAPVIVANGWTEEQVRAYTIADNRLGDTSTWDDDILRAELVFLEGSAEFDLNALGFSEADFAKVLAETDGGGDQVASEWANMPEFDQQDKQSFRSLVVHFKDQAAVDAFAKLVGQGITDKTRFLWVPAVEIERYADKRYAADE